jgi:hypothetical protein
MYRVDEKPIHSHPRDENTNQKPLGRVRTGFREKKPMKCAGVFLSRALGARNYVRMALADLAVGNLVSVPQVPSYGCSLMEEGEN